MKRLYFTARLCYSGPAALALCCLLSFAARSATLDEQRQLFPRAELALEAGRMVEFEQTAARLSAYPLHPYLIYKKLRAQPWRRDEIETYLADFADSRYAPLLRQSWLEYLAANELWDPFIVNFRETGNAGLQCRYYWALYRTGRIEEAYAGAEKLWLVGKSQPAACDPLFAAWRESPAFHGELAWRRFEMAMDRGEIGLADYLKRLLPEVRRAPAEDWLEVHKRPETVLSCSALDPSSPVAGRIFAHGIERLAQTDPAAALGVWQQRRDALNIAPDERQRIERRLALALAVRRHPQAYDYLTAVDGGGEDESVRGWRVRSALWTRDWPRVSSALDALPDRERTTPRWRYWRARALQALGHESEAQLQYQAAARTRDFFGFLAAGRAGVDFTFGDRPAPISELDVRMVAAQPAFQAAYEFLYFGREMDARAEWWHGLRALDRRGALAAAKLAEKWNWSPIAISTIARAEYWDDLALRFPLDYRESIIGEANRHSLDPSLVFAVVRRESSFDRDARSPAGARGLMQIMPRTGEQLARDLARPWESAEALSNPATNILYGTAYLQQLLGRFDHNVALAAAAYNAGPGRVSQWLPADRPVPADIWIETIPFKETRQYVAAVLEYRAVYSRRLGNEARTMTRHLPDVMPAARELAPESPAIIAAACDAW